MQNAIQDEGQTKRQSAPGVHELLARGEPGPIRWCDDGVLHSCEGLMLTESIRTSIVVTACGKAVPDNAISYRYESDPPMDCPACVSKPAGAW